MPRRPSLLPASVQSAPFSVRDILAQGVGRRRLRAHDLDARVHGVRVLNGTVDDLWTRCHAFAVRLPREVFFSHSTAARLLGAPLPLRLERMQDLHVSVEAPRRAPHAAGLRGHSRQVLPGDVITIRGLRLSSPARMWCEMGRGVDLADLVALTDYLIHHRSPWLSTADLGERLAMRDRISRAAVLARALELSSDRSESPPESQLRVICVLAGLPAVEVNHELIDIVTGRGVRLDLAWPALRFALEYQGDGHRTKSQWRRDMTRRENLRLAGWRILELNADDLAVPDVLVVRIRAALAS